jgi:hypothetical protein
MPDKRGAEKPLSLAPLSFEEAVADLLKVKPPPKVEPEKPAAAGDAAAAARRGKPKRHTSD